MRHGKLDSTIYYDNAWFLAKNVASKRGYVRKSYPFDFGVGRECGQHVLDIHHLWVGRRVCLDGGNALRILDFFICQPVCLLSHQTLPLFYFYTISHVVGHAFFLAMDNWRLSSFCGCGYLGCAFADWGADDFRHEKVHALVFIVYLAGGILLEI